MTSHPLLPLALRSESPSALVSASEPSVALKSFQESSSSLLRSEDRIRTLVAPSAPVSVDNGSSPPASRSADEPLGPPPYLDASPRPNSQTSLYASFHSVAYGPSGALRPSTSSLRRTFQFAAYSLLPRASQRTLEHRSRPKAQPLSSGSHRDSVEPVTDCRSISSIPHRASSRPLTLHDAPKNVPESSSSWTGSLSIVPTPRRRPRSEERSDSSGS